jgi:hypothetical protein
MTKHLMLEIIMCWKEQAIPASENSGDESARLDIETNSKQIHSSSSYNMETMVTGKMLSFVAVTRIPKEILFLLERRNKICRTLTCPPWHQVKQ